MAFGSVMGFGSPELITDSRYIVGGGFLLSALLQHWAYYNLRKWLRAEYRLSGDKPDIAG